MDITAHELLVLLPAATALTLASRLLIGVTTIGTFAPALLAITVMQLGAVESAAALLVAGGATMIAAPVLDRLALPTATRLSVNVVIVIAALVGSGIAAGQGSAAPVVVLAIVMERTWDSLLVAGPTDAVRLYGATIGLAYVIALLLSNLGPGAFGLPWYATAAIGVAANVAIGSYRGLRLTELRRFRPVHLAMRTEVGVAS